MPHTLSLQPLICPHCDRNNFKSIEGLKKHINFHCQKNKNNEPSSSFVCDHCKKSYSSKKNLDKHIKIVHAKKDGATSPKRLKDDPTIPPKLIEPIPAAPEITIPLSKRAKKTSAEIEPTFFCLLCAQSFNTPERVEEHYNLHHGNRKKMVIHPDSPKSLFRCEFCLKHFPTFDKIRSHVYGCKQKNNPESSSSKKLFFSCDICPEMFNSQNLLQLHKRQIHSAPPHHTTTADHHTNGINEEFDTEADSNLRGLFNEQDGGDDNVLEENEVATDEERNRFINGQMEPSELYYIAGKYKSGNDYFNSRNIIYKLVFTALGRRLVETGLFLEVVNEMLTDILAKAGVQQDSKFLQISSK